jgi:hypothetical protein
MEGPRPTRCLAAALALVLVNGCASDMQWRDGRAVHRELGFSVATPPGGAWERVAVEGAWLAYRHPAGAHMSLQTRCFRRYLNAQLRARHLLIGVAPRTLRQSGPVSVGPYGGWSQRVDVGEGPTPIRLKTLTLLIEDCAYDWLLTAHDDFDALEPVFDAWWQSFEREPAGGPS